MRSLAMAACSLSLVTCAGAAAATSGAFSAPKATPAKVTAAPSVRTRVLRFRGYRPRARAKPAPAAPVRADYASVDPLVPAYAAYVAPAPVTPARISATPAHIDIQQNVPDRARLENPPAAYWCRGTNAYYP